MAHYYFSHYQLTPNDTMLLLDEQDYTITLLQAEQRVAQSRFNELEWRVLTLFFQERGIHCTYDEALAALTRLPSTLCRERIQAAKLKDVYEETVKHAFFAEMKPVRNLLFGCQSRLHTLGLHVGALLDYGYVVTAFSPGA